MTSGLMYESHRRVLRQLTPTEIPWCVSKPGRHFFADDATLCYCGQKVFEDWTVRER